MMSTALTMAHSQLVREVADSYVQQGFSVQTEPVSADMPQILQQFAPPDLIVTTASGERLFVEVKLRGRDRDAAYWKQVQQKIEALPGWRFEYVTDNRREQELIDSCQPLFTDSEVETHLQEGQRLAAQGLPDGGLLLIWAALEAILRRMARQENITLPNQSPSTLMTKLVSEGSLDRDDYTALMQIMRAQNQAAHGHHPEHLDLPLVERTQAIARRLLEQQREPQQAA